MYRSLLSVGGFTLLSRATGFVRDIVMAAVMGSGPLSDAFFIAFRLPNHFRTIFAEGAYNAAFVPLYGNAAAADLPPFDVAVLGMGSDGHTASFFPGGDRLTEALDSDTPKRLIEMTAPGAGEPRLTFTLPVLEQSGRLKLHIEGAGKRTVLDKALTAGPEEEMPVRAVLRSATPVTLYWCP